MTEKTERCLMQLPAIIGGLPTFHREGEISVTDSQLRWEPYSFGPWRGKPLSIPIKDIRRIELVESNLGGGPYILLHLPKYELIRLEGRSSRSHAFVALALANLPVGWLLRRGNRSGELYALLKELSAQARVDAAGQRATAYLTSDI
jgi:hypothetical protein